MVKCQVDGNMHPIVVVVCTSVLFVPDVLTQELNIGKFTAFSVTYWDPVFLLVIVPFLDNIFE